jgi:hypothetical protein
MSDRPEFNQRHKASFTGSWERDDAQSHSRPDQLAGWLTASFPQTACSAPLSYRRFPRTGERSAHRRRKNWVYVWASFLRPDSVGDEARAALRRSATLLCSPACVAVEQHHPGFGGAAARTRAALWNYADTVSWTRKHGFKGFEARFTSSRGFNGSDQPEFYALPLVAVGAGGAAVAGHRRCWNLNQPGLTGSSVTTAQNLLLDLTGSVSASR